MNDRTSDAFSNDAAFAMTSPLAGPAPEVAVSTDIIKRGLMVAPVLVGIAYFIWGGKGAASASYGIALVLLNFALAAAIIAFTSRISLTVMMGGIMFGYILRLAMIFLAVFVVRHAGWISLPALGATIVVTHLGLLVWELKYVSLSLAYPALHPTSRPHSK